MSTVTTMDALHDSILESLRARFSDRVAQYGAYEPWDEADGDADKQIITPALLLEIEDFDIPDLDDPDPLGRLVVSASISIHCVLSVQTERLQQTLPQFAAAVAAVVVPPLSGDQYQRGNLWGLGGAVEIPEDVQAQPAGFTPGLNGRDSWVVRWTQTVYLDEEVPL